MNHNCEEAIKYCEKILNEIRELKLPEIEQTEITVSCGIAIKDEKINDSNKLFEVADKSLYKAKNSGKNRIVYNKY